MQRRWFIAPALAAVAGLAFGCGGGHEQEEGHHGAGGAAVAVPAHYPEAVAKCEELSDEIGRLIAASKLSEVHAAAEGIRKIAEKLPELAKKDLPAAMLKDVNVKSKELAGTFSEIDGAADVGKKEETRKIHEKMKRLIADLKKHAAHADHK